MSGKAEGAGGGTVRHPSDHLPYTDNQTEFGTCNKIGIRTKEEYHEIAFNFFFFTGMSLHCVTAGAQWVVTDPGNTAQGIINAANTASTVKQTVEQVNRLQTALDYVQKVSATVRRARMFTDLIDRQNRLNSNCLRTLEEAEKMDMKELPGITSAVQDVVANNAAIISLTGDILSSDLKMNDSERMEQLDGCLQEVRRQEASLGTIRQIMSHTRTIRRNLGLVTE